MLLEQSGRIGALRLKNRVVMAPMGTNYSTTDGLSTERDKLYYAERARGGVAMIMTEAMVVTEHARPHHNSLCCYHDRFIPGLAGLVGAIKAHDCHVFGQLNHRGALLRRSVLNMEPVGPSPWKNPNTGDEVRPLAIPEIIEIEKLFVTAAKRLCQAGYDGVEVHAGNGYLFQQFFTPRINKRTDCYGGCLDNRARFLLETICRIKAALPDFPLIVRLSASEFAGGGYTETEIIELAGRLEREGVAALDLSGGSNESPQLSKYCIQPPSFRRGCLGPYAKPIKQAVEIPVLVAGRVVDPADAEALLRDGCADFISIGRALYSDPHWCLKAFGRVSAPIRKCIACNICFERLTLEKDVACVHNPMIGTDFETLEHAEAQLFPTLRTRDPKRVLVLGAGVTGVEAARAAASRGHHVEVWEKSGTVGGQMPLALAAPDKLEVEPVWSYRWQQIKALGVPVRISTVATSQAVKAFAPDFVIVATGARPRPCPFDVSGLDAGVRVLHAWDVLRDPAQIASAAAVTIIGGGMVGMETADLLTLQGKHCTVIEALDAVAQNMARNNRMELLDRLEARGTVILVSVTMEKAQGRHVELRAADGTARSVDVGDCLVIATGPEPDRDVVPLLEEAGVEYALAGDCYRPGDFLSCLRDAWMTALSIELRFRGPRLTVAEAPRNQYA
jgi:2,4-dienoyl-CoA reductase-like NADH-dependent reductase (Old Yellow Enzyme family)/NADPH-dependent 2,4-dienoyl-CoA reductase/sulfur reductase-like enzyme